MRTGSSLRAALLAVTLAAFAVPASAETFLVVPFANGAGAPDLEWVGESFAESLADSLQANGRTAIPREDRLAALERLGLPSSGPLTHASALRLGEEVGADWVVLGHYEVAAGRIRSRAQLLDLAALSVTAAIEDQDAFDHLIDVQLRLAWRILRQLDPRYPLSLVSFQQRRPAVSVSAFESYIRGLLASDREQQLRYFLQAARLEPAFAPPAFRLAMLYYLDGDYTAATRWFDQASADPRLGPEAGFYLSLCYFATGELPRAAEALLKISTRAPSAGLWNNLGVIASRQKDGFAEAYFTRALQADHRDARIHFNLGLHYVRRGEWELALRSLQRALTLDPRDTEAHYLRAHVLRQLGRLEEAERAQQQAVGDNPALALSLDRRLLELDRLHMEFQPLPASEEARR
ncbi:MAG: tetratricopeptide repeat protein [Acidobacteria bacterium]|nr:tetratricopeptide repeat protein [Acidobacteriota bacterium]